MIKKIIIGTFFLFLFTLSLNNALSYLDPDFGWHLNYGQKIATELTIPSINRDNFSLWGRPWVDHEWLANLAIYQIHQLGGFVLAGIIFTLLALMIFIILKIQAHSNSLVSYLLLTLGFVACLPHFGIRIQEISALFLLLELILLRKQKFWPLVPLLWLWANLHAGFLLGIGILLMYEGIKIIEQIINKTKYNKLFIITNFPWRKVTIVSILAIGATLLTPYYTKLYGFLFDYRDTFYLTHIAEWLPQWSGKVNGYQLCYLAIIILIGVYLIIKKRQINLFETGLMILLTIITFKSKRHFPLLLVASLPLVINTVDEFIKAKKVLPAFTKKIINYFLLISLVLTSAMIIVNTNFNNQPFQYFCSHGQTPYPCDALKFLQANPQLENKRIFNSYGWGGFLIRTYPAGRLFIDGRLPQMKLKDTSIIQEYYNFANPQLIAQKLAAYQIELVIISKHRESQISTILKILNRLGMIKTIPTETVDDKISSYLERENAWEKIYVDQTTIIYLKN